MKKQPNQPHILNMALRVLKYRREKHPLGKNYAVRVRLGHAEIQDITAISDILSAVSEMGYEIIKKPQ